MVESQHKFKEQLNEKTFRYCGSSFVVEWNNGLLKGKANLIDPDGLIYFAEFKDGKPVE